MPQPICQVYPPSSPVLKPSIILRLLPLQIAASVLSQAKRWLPSPLLYPLTTFFMFPLHVNLLSINTITKALYCFVKFFPYHYVFQDLWIGKRIGFGREISGGLNELVLDTPSVVFSCLFSQKSSLLLWHWCFGHANISKLCEVLLGISLFEFQCESCQLG